MNAAEHFDWAVTRAREYVDRGDGGAAMASLVSDLGNHRGTASILNAGLVGLFCGEVMLAGAEGARRFIDGLPRPVHRPCEGGQWCRCPQSTPCQPNQETGAARG